MSTESDTDESGDDNTDESAIKLTLTDIRGFPDSIANDLSRADGGHADQCSIKWDEESEVVTVKAETDAAAEWLYQWLEDTRQHYAENYVNARGDVRAARELAAAVFEEVYDDE